MGLFRKIWLFWHGLGTKGVNDVSKKKRRFERRVCRRVDCKASGCDKHHIFFTRRAWRSGLAFALRHNPYSIVMIPRATLHKQIHESARSVPVPSNYAIEGAFEQLNLLEKRGAISETDNIEKRLKVFIALFECIADPTANALRKQLEIVQNYYHKPP